MTSKQRAMKLYTSDWHLGHIRCATEFRGFDSVEVHDDLILSNFRDQLNGMIQRGIAEFDLYFCGDLTSGSLVAENAAIQELFEIKASYRARGIALRYHSIAGNHDSWWGGHRKSWERQVVARQTFDTFHEFQRAKIAGQRVYLHHMPWRGAGDHTVEERYSEFRLTDDGSFLIHGHTHSIARQTKRMLNVAVDAWNFTPVTHDEIVHQIMRTLEVEAAMAELEAPQ